MWTYVTGIIKADTYSATDAETMYIAQTVVNHLPKITGSEGNVNIHVYMEDGHNSSSNADEFHNFSNLGEGYFKNFEHQDRVVITLSGYLRDRTFEQTLKETNKFICRLAKRLSIYDCLVKVDGYDKSYIFDNTDDWLTNLYPEWNEEEWSDYLRWVPNRDEDDSLIGGKPRMSTEMKQYYKNL